MIQVRQVTKAFGGFPAVRAVSFDAPDGAITALLGMTSIAAALLLIVCTGRLFQRDAIVYGD